jgi:putative peptidoglycan lipid II flippase
MTEHGVGADEEEPPPYDQDEAELAEQAQSGMLRNSAVMASGSVLSRVTGVLRNTALGAALGTTIVGDAFVLGNSLPGIVYVLVIGGALNAVFVPQLVRRMKDDADGGKGYTDSLLSLTGVTLIVVTLIAIVAAPLIVSLYATSGYDSNQLGLAIAFTRYCLPQILFFGLYAMLSQILNARGSFGMPMYAPVLNNLVAIATYTSFVLVVGTSIASTGEITAAQTAWLGLGTTLGIVAQALVLVPVLIRAGYRWNFTRKWRGVGLGKSGRLAGWTIALVMATQLGFVVISRLATAANLSATADGDPAGLVTYTNAYLVFMIPHGVVTVSIVTAQLPHLSRQVHAGLTREAGAAIGHTLRLVATVITPLALALIIGAQSISELMFRYGGLTVEMASQIGTVTAIFMIGLLPFTLYFVLQRGWYAREDTRSPFFFSLLTNGLLVVLAVLLFRIATPGAAQVNALALAYAISCWVTFVAAWPVLARAYGSLDTIRTLTTFARIVAAAAISGGVTWALTRLVPALDFQPGQSRGSALVDLTVTSLVIMGVFVGAAWALRVGEMQELLAWVRGAARRGRR